jgi:phosphate transport system substrate-binding protein
VRLRKPGRLRVARRILALAGIALMATTNADALPSAYPRSASGPTILGDGAMFSAPELSQWAADVAKQPYNLSIDFSPTTSDVARFDFAQQTVDFGVSDIRFDPSYDYKIPAPGTFIYIPISAGGLAFMYNLPTVANLQLSSYSACALFTGAIPFWDNPIIQADNPGLVLPHIPVVPVLNGGDSGTNYVFEEYCIAEQPALWSAFVTADYKTSVLDGVSGIYPNMPSSFWPVFPKGLFVAGADQQADSVTGSGTAGDITDVEPAYAIQRHMPVASVKNASGLYVQPSDVNVASALAYAVQQPDGTHVLNFGGLGPNVYNPSTYNYALAPTAGFNPAKGFVLGSFLNFDLTLGQQQASGIGYSSLALSLERQGVSRATAIPGDPGLTPAEQAGYACGDLTTADVAKGITVPVCGAVNPNTLPLGGVAGSANSGTARAGGGSSGSSSVKPSASATSGSGGGSAVPGGGPGSANGSVDGLLPAAGLDPSLNLASTVGPIGDTGIDAEAVAAFGVLLMVAGAAIRRRHRLPRRT